MRVQAKEINALTIGETNTFLKHARGSKFHIVFLLAVHTGMRLNEILALRWSNVDNEYKQLNITHTLIPCLERGLVIRELKTQKAKRTIILPQLIVDELEKHKLMQSKNETILKSNHVDHQFVNRSKDGRPINPRLIQREFYQVIQKAGLPNIVFNNLRYTYISNLYQKEGV